VRKVPDLARPSFDPVRSSTTSMGRLNFSASMMVAKMPKTPMRLATKFGVSSARTTPLPSTVVRNVSSRSRMSGVVSAVGMISTRCM
jgi:hypothetical protein